MAGTLSPKSLLIFIAISYLQLHTISSISLTKPTRTRLTKPTTTTDFIKKSCTATTYPRLCYTSLVAQASKIQPCPKLIAHAALNVTLSSAKAVSTMMSRLSKTKNMSPRVAAAVRDCVEELGNSVDEIRQSINEMSVFKESDFGLMISDVQTWVSAALTDESTCSDGFEGSETNGKVKNVVRGQIVNIAHLTSNALALVNTYASLRG